MQAHTWGVLTLSLLPLLDSGSRLPCRVAGLASGMPCCPLHMAAAGVLCTGLIPAKLQGLG